MNKIKIKIKKKNRTNEELGALIGYYDRSPYKQYLQYPLYETNV